MRLSGSHFSVSLIALAAAAAPASAQNAPGGAGVTTLDAVTVTGTKTPQRREDVPASIDSVGTEELEQLQPQSLDDVLRNMPGVESTGGPRRLGESPSIRGLSGQRVVVTIDGARQNFEAGHKGRIFLDPDLLKQVEVLKGPSSSIHGSGAIGGVVALTTRGARDFLRPDETYGFRAKYGFSSGAREGLYSLTGFARPLEGIDSLAHVAYRDAGTIQLGGGTELADSAEELTSQLYKLGVDLAPHHRIELSGHRLDEDGDTPINPEASISSSNALAERRTEFSNLTLNYAYSNPANLLLDTRFVAYRTGVEVYERRKSDSRRDVSDLETRGFELYNTSRINPGGNVAHALTYGLEYFADDQAGKRNGAPRPEFPSAHSHVTGVYVQDNITVLRDLTIVPALRFDAYSGQNDSVANDSSESAVSPRIGALWRALPWASVYANYAHAFRAPTLTELFVSGTHFPGNSFVANPNLAPEKSEGWEAGTRLKFDNVLTARDRLRFSIAYFDTQYEDFIETVVGATTTTNVNLTRASISGVESQLAYDAPLWFASLALSRLRGENDALNQPLNSVPADKAVTTLGARLAPWDTIVGLRSEFVAEQDRVSTVDVTGFGLTPKTGGYVVHGLFASWQPTEGWMRGLRLDAGIDNLLDKSYRRHLANLREEGRDFHAAISYQMAF